MADMEPDISRKKTATQIGDSDDFVLPVAPPPAPLGHTPGIKRTREPNSEPSSSSSVSGESVPAASEPRAVLAPANVEPDHDTTGQAAPLISDLPGKSAPWSLVILLVCLVIGLLFVIANKSNETPKIAPPVASSGIDERELATALSNAESMRNKAAQLEQQIAEMEQQREAERKVAVSKVEKLLREKRTLEDNSSNLMVEVDRLKRLMQSTVPKDPPRPAPTPAEPVVSNNSNLYMVSGLRPGDTLNVRSGPSASNTIVIRLSNGDEISVVGAAVTNGPDSWLPCMIDKTFLDSSTGLNKSVKQKGWVNSIFVELVPSR